MCDSNDEAMETRYHQDGDSQEVKSSSYNLVDGYSYDKWLQEQDPMEIDTELVELKKDFPDFKPQMIRNVLLREDVKRDLKKARELLEGFRVMRARDQNQSQQEPNWRSNREQNYRGGKRGAKQWNRGRGRGRGGNKQEHNFTRNNNCNQGPSLFEEPQQRNFTRNNNYSQRPSLLGEPPSQLAYWQHQGQHAPFISNDPRSQAMNPRFMGPNQQPFPSSYQNWQRNQRQYSHCNTHVQRFDTPRPLFPEQMASGNNPGRNTGRMEGSKLDDKFASQRLSNESLNSNASSSSGNPNNQNNRGRNRGGRNRRKKGRNKSTEQHSKEAPGALETTRTEGEMCGPPRGIQRIGRAQSFAAFERSMVLQEQNRFEPNMLCVLDVSHDTTAEGLQNFIEAKSGEEVVNVTMFQNGKALVTLKALTDFNKVKQKAEQKRLDGAQLEIQRLEVCKTIHVSGLSQDTTTDALQLYFENTRRSGGGVVQETDYNSGEDKALVHFASPKVVEKVLAKEHNLNGASLVVRKYYPDLEDSDDEENESDKSKISTNPIKLRERKPVFKANGTPSEDTAGLQLSISVDPEKMTCLTISGERKNLDATLKNQNCTLQWKNGQKHVLVVYRGNSQDWRDKCIETINKYMDSLNSCTIEIDGKYAEGVVAQLPAIRKAMKHKKVAIMAEQKHLRMTCVAVETHKCKEEIQKVVQEIAEEEEKKTYKSTTIPDIPEENIALLKKINIFDELKSKNKNLNLVIDEENGSIRLEGPPDQFKEASIALRRQMHQIGSRSVSVTSNALKVLSSEDGMNLVKREMKRNDLDAVFVVDTDTNKASVVGKSSVEAEKAAHLIKNMVLEQKIEVEKQSFPLLKNPEWKALCENVPKRFDVFIHRNEYGDTWVTGFKQDVLSAVEEFQTFLDDNTVRRETFTADKLVLRYFNTYMKRDLSLVVSSLKEFNVKVTAGSDEENLIISGTKEGLERTRTQLHRLTTSVAAEVYEVKQPGVKRLFQKWNGESLVRSVEKEHSCIIQVEQKFDSDAYKKGLSSPVRSISPKESSSYKGEPTGSSPQTVDKNYKGTSVKTGANYLTITTAEKKTISWKVGDITKEQADILLASVASNLDLNAGPFARTFSDAAGPSLQQACNVHGTLGIGEVMVTVPGNLPCNNVILAVCCNWSNGAGEAVLRKLVKKSLEEAHRLRATSIAMPTLGTGNLKFPWSAASSILTEEAIAFSQRYASSTLRDIRVIVFEKDQKSIREFQKDIVQVQSQHGIKGPSGRSVNPVYAFGGEDTVQVEVLQGDITQETTEVIVNINSTDMNMNKAGAVSKAIAQASGPSVELECQLKGQQQPGAVVMTTAGNLRAQCILHVIPGGGSVDDTERSVENCLKVADANGYSSISLPALGTGSAGGDPQRSAQSMLRAVNNFRNQSPQNIRHIRIVIFQGQMVSVFQHEQQRLGLDNSMVPMLPTGTRPQESDKVAKQVMLRHSGSARLHIRGRDRLSVDKVIKALQKTFSDHLTKQKVEQDAVNFLSELQVKKLEKKATDLDVDIEIEPRVSRVVVSGNPKDVAEIIGVVYEEISHCKEKQREKERAQLVAKNVQWYYTLNSRKIEFPFKKNANAELEVAHTHQEKKVKLVVEGVQFDIDISSKRGVSVGEQVIEIRRQALGAGEEGISLPSDWDPMPPGTTVRLVPLRSSSAEYQRVQNMFVRSGGNRTIVTIERVQNPMLYRTYIVRKQEMDKENGRTDNERELWHGTNSKNIKSINEQGFNRSFCGVNGTAYGNGVYFARDASYSMGYATGGKMYLARVLVGTYTIGRSGLIVPPAKNPSSPEILFNSVVNNQQNPSIHVVFFDAQCYPEYLITFH